jgi:hypothetical protein
MVLTGAVGILMTVFTTVALAQGGGGAATLVGTITDSTQAVVPGARVTVVNPETSFRSETQSGPEGNYYVPYLAPGTYRITVEAGGFKRYVRDGFTIRTGETPRLDISLEVGALAEEVTVRAAPPLLATENASAGQILEGETLLNIPVSQRRFARLLYYFPGATSSAAGDHVAGQRSRAIGYTLDGIGGKPPGYGTFGGVNESIQTTMDAVEEVKVSTSGISADTGHAAGGTMAVVFRSGTNDLHGQFEGRHINKIMIQRHYLQQDRQTNPFKYFDLGGTLAGPIYLPKLYNLNPAHSECPKGLQRPS